MQFHSIVGCTPDQLWKKPTSAPLNLTQPILVGAKGHGRTVPPRWEGQDLTNVKYGTEIKTTDCNRCAQQPAMFKPSSLSSGKTLPVQRKVL